MTKFKNLGSDLSFELRHYWLFFKLTPSWQFFSVCLALIAGLALGDFFSLSLIYLYAIFWLLVIAVAASWRRPPLFFLFLVVLFIMAGWSRAEMFRQSSIRQEIKGLAGSKQILFGQVVGVPRAQKLSQRYNFEIDKVESAPSLALGEVVTVVARPFPEVTPGDYLKLNCALALEDENSRQPIVCLFPEVTFQSAGRGSVISSLARIKELFTGSLVKIMPEPAAGFVMGLLVGGRSGLNAEWRDALNNTGTAHLVALSGFNVTIIAYFLLIIVRFLRVSRRWHTLIVGFILSMFVIMVGAEASIVRAAVMGMLVVIARHSGRAASSRNTIMLAAALMLLVNPALLTADIGFQLSFLATLGMIYLYPIFERATKRWPSTLGFKEALLMALAAEIFVTPLIIFYFERWSLIAPLINMLVVPPVPFIMLFGFLGGLIGLAAVPLGQIFGFGGYIGATYVLGVISVGGRLPLAAVSFSVSLAALLVYYLILGGLLIWYYKRMEYRSKLRLV